MKKYISKIKINDTFLYFYFPLIIIITFGASLRFIDYASVPPFQDTADEIVYPLAGMSWIQTGTPMGWENSGEYPYTRHLEVWGTWYNLVMPWMMKPPLYTFLNGGIMHLIGARNFTDIRLETIRIFPIILSLFTIFLIAVLGKKISKSGVGLLAAGIYAFDPTIILSNRLNLTENLLEPLIILTIIFLFARECLSVEDKIKINKNTLILCILCALSVLTKQLGIAVPLALFVLFIEKKEWRAIIAITISSAAALGLYLYLAWFYGWETFVNGMKIFKFHMTGVPELINSIFKYPFVVNRYELLPDGLMLLGYILLFSSPWWLHKSKQMLLYIPFAYLTLLAISETAHESANFYGWHLFPFFPFIAILISLAINEIWSSSNKIQVWVLSLILILSSIRFTLLIYPNYQTSWQLILGLSLAVIGILTFWRIKIAVIILAITVLITNIAVTSNLDKLYGKRIQPKEEIVIPIKGLLN